MQVRNHVYSKYDKQRLQRGNIINSISYGRIIHLLDDNIMSKIKDTIIEEQDTGVNVYGKKTRDELLCERCSDTGIVEIMGGSDADEWGVIDEKPCTCGQTPYRKIL